MRNWFTQLLRLRSPVICSLPLGDSRKPVVLSQFKSRDQRTRRTYSVNPSPRAEKSTSQPQKASRKQTAVNSSFFHQSSLVAQYERIHLQCRKHRRHWFNPWIRKIPWRRKRQPTPSILAWIIPWAESLVDYSPWGPTEFDTTKQVCLLLPSFCSIQGLNRLGDAHTN